MTTWTAGAAFRGTINIYDGMRQVAVVGTSIAPDVEQIKRDAALITGALGLLAANQLWLSLGDLENDPFVEAKILLATEASLSAVAKALGQTVSA
jgi:hypothetical protein